MVCGEKWKFQNSSNDLDWSRVRDEMKGWTIMCCEMGVNWRIFFLKKSRGKELGNFEMFFFVSVNVVLVYWRENIGSVTVDGELGATRYTLRSSSIDYFR